MTVNDRKYEASKENMESRFFSIICDLPELAPLAEFIEDKHGIPTRRLYAFCGGDREPAKYYVLNNACMFFSKNFKKLTADKLPSNASEEDKAKCENEPGSCLKYLTQLFAVFRTKGIVYSLLHDFSGAGGGSSILGQSVARDR